MNHNSQTGPATPSPLRMIVDSLQATTPRMTEQPDGSKGRLVNSLDELSFPEVKALYFIIQTGRTPSWLRESDSIRSLYENLCGIAPVTRGMQNCIDFILSVIDNLQIYIARYFGICNELRLDPFNDLEILVQEEIAQGY